MQHWLLKTEPSTFGVADLQAAPRRRTSWDGVRNYQARNYIRDQIKKGDEAFLYHSSCEIPGIVAIVRVVRAAYPDSTAFDRRDPHYDSGSNADAPRWFTFDVQLKRRLKRVIALSELQAHARDALASMMILRAGNRLSVTPIEAADWRFILTLE
jgi:predicted RNA-binding protein with PUA-like domain